jgi:hypothetical protein
MDAKDVRNSDSLVFRPISSQSEFITTSKLVYDQYYSSGYIKANNSGIRFFLRDLLPTTDIFLAEQDGLVVGTATIYSWSDAQLPAFHVFPNEVNGLLRGQRSLVEGSRFASKFYMNYAGGNLSSFDKFNYVGAGFTRLVFEYCQRFGINDWIVIINPKVLQFYISQLGFQQISNEKLCSHVNANPGYLMRLDINEIMNGVLQIPDYGYEILFNRNFNISTDISVRFNSEEVMQLVTLEPQVLNEATPEEMLVFNRFYPEVRNSLKESHCNIS